jgi:uncharacterized protein
MATPPSMAERDRAALRGQVVIQMVVLGLPLALLVNYKSTAGLRRISEARTSGTLRLSTLQIGHVDRATAGFSSAIAYLKIVWPALVFGVLISAAVRTSLSQTPMRRIFEGGTARDQVAAALAGAPLMLCSCCVAPIFPAVYERTRRLGPSLGLTLASPSLNPIALTLSFILFPWRIAGARLAMALILVLVGCIVVARLTPPTILATPPESGHPESGWPGLLAGYGNSIAYVSLRTVPLILTGIWASMWIMEHIPLHRATGIGGMFAIAVIALFAVLLTLPTLYEIPLALSLLAAGGPAGLAAVMLFAGPAINLPSLLVIGRYSSWKVALALVMLVWAIATGGGLLLSGDI